MSLRTLFTRARTLPQLAKRVYPAVTIMNSSASSHSAALTRDKLFDLSGRVALVTGGGSGIGLMATQTLAANGAKVYITGRTGEKLQRAVEAHSEGISGEIIPLTCDVTKKEEITKLYDQISSNEKCLCILINNAGISSSTFETKASNAQEMKENLFNNKDATFEDWDSTYRADVSQVYFMTTAFLPLLEKSTQLHPGFSGTVINISSISGLVKSTQHHPAYNSAKAATIHLTRLLANELASNNIKIRINGIAPGVFPSEMTADKSDDKQKSHIPKEKFEDKVPAQRPGKDEDMAQAVLFMACNQYVSGQTVVVDGGYTLASGL